MEIYYLILIKIEVSEDEIENKSLHHQLINNHDTPANKAKIKGLLSLQHIFGFCRIFKRLLNNYDFI